MQFRRGPEEGGGCEGTPGAGSSGAGGDGAPPPSPSPPPKTPPSPLTPSSTDDVTASSGEEWPSFSLSSPPPLSPQPRWILEYEARENERIEQYLSELRIQEQSPYNPHLNSIYPEFHSQLPPDDTSERAPPRDFIGRLGHKEGLMVLAGDFGKDNNIIMQKIRLLREKYDFFRRTDRDGNCFYRAFIFNYLENIAEIQDAAERGIEAARCRQCVEKSMQANISLFSLGIPEEQILRALSGSDLLVQLVEAGSEEELLYLFEMEDGITSRMLPLLRLLTEIEICTHEDFYKHFLIPGEADGYGSVFEFCREEVRPENSEANDMQLRALVNALGIPLIVEILDRSLIDSVVRLNHHQYYPRPESEAGQMLGHGSVSSLGTGCMGSVSSECMELLNLPCTSGSSTNSSMEALELQSTDTDSAPPQGGSGEHHGQRNLSAAERRRLVTLLYRPGHYDILYPK